jgi:hypothetical protein
MTRVVKFDRPSRVSVENLRYRMCTYLLNEMWSRGKLKWQVRSGSDEVMRRLGSEVYHANLFFPVS